MNTATSPSARRKQSQILDELRRTLRQSCGSILRILLIVDDMGAFDSLRKILESQIGGMPGSCLVTVSNYAEALSLFGKHAFHGIFSNISILLSNGLGLCAQIRSEDEAFFAANQNAYEVAITTVLHREHILACSLAGVDEIIKQPFHTEDIKRCLFAMTHAHADCDPVHQSSDKAKRLGIQDCHWTARATNKFSTFSSAAADAALLRPFRSVHIEKMLREQTHMSMQKLKALGLGMNVLKDDAL
ncbi:uncharacterized protein FA14DRAFT_182923 [Meira miltonrushii]|uniref:Response regulatory domain-containing protein n=1 Tax=Meira miltonrushii TaxID=1280837 RepID=A0A316V4Q9_9BASI|nr:uncharacterized protein FA14DRAFT_182923 [Meira miltonrushii]PWN31213.1 hypothetical protein FA14DRAFT_182923 [Meira miltonrushii]